MTLSEVREFVVPLSLIDETLKPLQKAGRHGCEAFVLWGGNLVDHGTRFEFVSSYVPAQTCSRGPDGLLVVVEGEALFRANQAFYRRGLTLACQVHSHPTDAYHSSTDDTFPLMTLIGGLSGVVPCFGQGGPESLDDWVWYQLVGPGNWAELRPPVGIAFK